MMLLNLVRRLRDYPLGYVPALDGLRGFLTLGVMLGHTNIQIFSGVAIFMDSFFVLSGYLITSLLLAEQKRTGTVSLTKFYRRRLRRLYPALCGMVLGIWALSSILGIKYPMTAREAFVALAYLKDYYHFLFNGSGMFTSLHLWSLAIEEQFYLIWPVLFLFVVGRGVPTWRAVSGMGAVVLAIWLMRAYGTYKGFSPLLYLYTPFHMRADSLLIGCALAFILTLAPPKPGSSLLSASALAAFIAAVFTVFTMGHLVPAYFYFASILAALGSAVVITALVYGSRSAVHRILENRFLMVSGKISYGLYLWHWPIFYVLDQSLPSQPAVLRIVIGWAASYLLATMSYIFLEARFMSKTRDAAAPARQRQGLPELSLGEQGAAA